MVLRGKTVVQQYGIKTLNIIIIIIIILTMGRYTNLHTFTCTVITGNAAVSGCDVVGLAVMW